MHIICSFHLCCVSDNKLIQHFMLETQINACRDFDLMYQPCFLDSLHFNGLFPGEPGLAGVH